MEKELRSKTATKTISRTRNKASVVVEFLILKKNKNKISRGSIHLFYYYSFTNQFFVRMFKSLTYFISFLHTSV
jgi:hypothetical protein